MKLTIDNLKCQFSTGKISRRDFIGGAAAIGFSLPAALSLSGQVLAATPKKGGTFRVGTTGASGSDSLDPALILDTYMAQVSAGQLRNQLTEIGQDGKLVGELAESWESSPDAKTWTFNIRKGVEFHNGKTLDSTDVVESINHHRGEDSKSAAKSVIEPITDIRVDGKNTVVITLSGGSADFPYLLSDWHLGICPAKPGGGIDWESGTGTGGYALEDFQPGLTTTTTRNPNYWKTGRAHFDEVETIFISDVLARTNALRTGEIHAMSKTDAKTADLLNNDPGITVFQTSGGSHISLPMRTNTAPFDNRDVRLALKYSIDREQWLKLAMHGYGELANDNPVGPQHQFRATNDELPQRAYDPDKAKFHLKQAGLSSLDVQYHASATAFEAAVDGGVLFAESARPAGINIEVVRSPKDGYWNDVWLKKGWCASFWGGRPTEDWILSQVYASTAAWNESAWKNDRFDKVLVEARSELDQSKRRDMYVELQQLVHDDGGSVIPLFAPYVQAVSTSIELPTQMSQNAELDGNRCAERWWFK